MEKINACIVSVYMPNINRKTVELQREVVNKFNTPKYPHYQFSVGMDVRHGIFLDYFWGMNGVKAGAFVYKDIEQKLNHDVVIILDIDCIPVGENAFEYYAREAAAGKLIGNAQRTNHLNNNQHVFAAPSASAISRETLIKIGAPSALETERSDVLEEYTWAAEQAGVEVVKLMPLRFDAPPQRYEWEKDKEPYWNLADGMPKYGMGTTYGYVMNEQMKGMPVDLFWHNFQIRMPGQEERFWNKCEEVLTKDMYEDRSIKH